MRPDNMPRPHDPEFNAEPSATTTSAEQASALADHLYRVRIVTPGRVVELMEAEAALRELAAIRREQESAQAGSAEPQTEPLPPEEMCPNCVTPWKCNGPHIPTHQPIPGELDK